MMANAQLDQRAAKLLGWTYCPETCFGHEIAEAYYKTPSGELLACAFTPSTNLTQAMGLWAEYEPEWHHVEIVMQGRKHDVRVVHACDGVRKTIYRRISPLPLPRAITFAWCAATEQEGKG